MTSSTISKTSSTGPAPESLDIKSVSRPTKCHGAKFAPAWGAELKADVWCRCAGPEDLVTAERIWAYTKDGDYSSAYKEQMWIFMGANPNEAYLI